MTHFGLGFIHPKMGVPTTWNPADKDAAVTLSNGDLTADNTTVADFRAVRSVAFMAENSGKYYCEFSTPAGTLNDLLWGLANSSASLNPAGGGASGRLFADYWHVGQTGAGTIYSLKDTVETQVGSGGLTASDRIMLAYNSDTRDAWIGDAGAWLPATNGGTVGDPAAGTFPTLGNLPSGDYALVTTLFDSANPATTMYIPSADWNYAAPSGFGPIFN